MIEWAQFLLCFEVLTPTFFEVREACSEAFDAGHELILPSGFTFLGFNFFMKLTEHGIEPGSPAFILGFHGKLPI
jgi:hypothetical protein